MSLLKAALSIGLGFISKNFIVYHLSNIICSLRRVDASFVSFVSCQCRGSSRWVVCTSIAVLILVMSLSCSWRSMLLLMLTDDFLLVNRLWQNIVVLLETLSTRIRCLIWRAIIVIIDELLICPVLIWGMCEVWWCIYWHGLRCILQPATLLVIHQSRWFAYRRIMLWILLLLWLGKLLVRLLCRYLLLSCIEDVVLEHGNLAVDPVNFSL